MEVLGKLEPPQKSAINALKHWMETKPAMAWFHNQGCEVNGPHFHYITHSLVQTQSLFEDTQPQATYSFKKVKGLFKKTGGYVKIQRVNNLRAILAYLTDDMHIFFGANKSYLLAHYHSMVWGPLQTGDVSREALLADSNTEDVGDLPEENVDEPPTDDAETFEALCGFKRPIEGGDDDIIFGDHKVPRTGDIDFSVAVCGPMPRDKFIPDTPKKGKPRMETQIESILEYMREQTTTNKDDIMLASSSTHPHLRQIVLHLQFDRMFQKAVGLYMLGADVCDPWVWYTVDAGDWLAHWALFHQWCTEQGLNMQLFLFQLYVVLFKMDPKINCFALIGAVNAGKSFWLKSLCPVLDLCGIVGKCSQFMWQDCLKKPLILMEEALMDTTTMETFKILAGGQETKVDVKFGGQGHIVRTPILLAANRSIWRCVPEAATAIRARCFIWEDLQGDSECLSTLQDVDISKHMWYVLLQWVHKYKNVCVDIARGEVDVPPKTGLIDWVSAAADQHDKDV